MACMVRCNVEGDGTRERVMRLAKTIGAFLADRILPVPVLALATRSALDAQLRCRPHYYEHPISAPRRRLTHNAQVLLRLLRCLSHPRQYERAEGAQQRSQPSPQRSGLLRADIERPDTASHQQYHRCVQHRRTGQPSVPTESDGRLPWRTYGRNAPNGNAPDGYAWFPTARNAAYGWNATAFHGPRRS
jgi:hypothetical protein